MKHRALAYAGVVLGVVALASSFAEPMAVANGSTGRTATITVTCQNTGEIVVGLIYSGFSGGVRGADFFVGAGETFDPVRGRSGDVGQGFNQHNVGNPIDWGAISAQLVGQNGRVIAGSTSVWNDGTPYTC